MFNTKKPVETVKPSQAPTTPSRPIASQSKPTPSQIPSNSEITKISKACFIKGDISGTSDIEFFGKLEGVIDIKNNTLSIEKSANIKANVFAKTVHIHGNIAGNIEAGSKIVISETGKVTGDMLAPKVILKDGSYFKGNVSMTDSKAHSKNVNAQKNK